MIVNRQKFYKLNNGVPVIQLETILKIVKEAKKISFYEDELPLYIEYDAFLETEPQTSIIEKIKFAIWGIIKGFDSRTIEEMPLEELIIKVFEDINYENDESFSNIFEFGDDEEAKSDKIETYLSMKYFLQEKDNFEIVNDNESLKQIAVKINEFRY